MIYKGSIVKGNGGGSGDAVWGSITGTLSDQTDLQTALNAKANTADIPIVDQTYSRTSTNAQSGVAVASAISTAIASVYKPAGSSAFANLPPLSASFEGYVFNITDDFTTTADFVEGAGKIYPAGTNIVCISTRNGYKWDVLSGIVDLSGYQTTSNLVTSISSSSTDSQYPSAKCVYDIVGNIDTALTAIIAQES